MCIYVGNVEVLTYIYVNTQIYTHNNICEENRNVVILKDCCHFKDFSLYAVRYKLTSSIKNKIGKNNYTDSFNYVINCNVFSSTKIASKIT